MNAERKLAFLGSIKSQAQLISTHRSKFCIANISIRQMKAVATEV